VTTQQKPTRPIRTPDHLSNAVRMSWYGPQTFASAEPAKEIEPLLQRQWFKWVCTVVLVMAALGVGWIGVATLIAVL
jgi:hypothetical protein